MIRHALAAALLLSALTACGDDDTAGTPVSTPAPTPVATPAADTSTPKAGGGAQLDSVLSDVGELAPALESYFRSRDYPTSVEEVVAALPKAGLKLSKGNSIGGYRYDPDDVEFVLCVENTSGAWATYDTAPMTTGQSGKTGGCPAS